MIKKETVLNLYVAMTSLDILCETRDISPDLTKPIFDTLIGTANSRVSELTKQLVIEAIGKEA